MPYVKKKYFLGGLYKTCHCVLLSSNLHSRFPAFSIHNIATLWGCTLLKSPNSPLTSAEQIRYSELTLFMGSFERGLLSYNLVAFIKIHFLASSMNSFVENVLYFSWSALEDPISKFIQINSFFIAYNSLYFWAYYEYENLFINFCVISFIFV